MTHHPLAIRGKRMWPYWRYLHVGYRHPQYTTIPALSNRRKWALPTREKRTPEGRAVFWFFKIDLLRHSQNFPKDLVELHSRNKYIMAWLLKAIHRGIQEGVEAFLDDNSADDRKV